MELKWTLFSIFTCLQLNFPTGESLINSELQKVKDFPFMARILCKVKESPDVKFCVGSIISERYVVTSAYCLWTADSVQGVIHGVDRWSDFSTNYIPVDTWIIHPKFDGFTYYDIGLVRVQDRFVFDDLTKPIILADANEESNYSNLTVLGFSKHIAYADAAKLNSVQTTLYKIGARCIKAYNPKTRNLSNHAIFHEDIHLCSTNVRGFNDCFQDDGAPLIVTRERIHRPVKTYILIATVSFIGHCTGQQPLGSTAISRVYRWIYSNVFGERTD